METFKRVSGGFQDIYPLAGCIVLLGVMGCNSWLPQGTSGGSVTGSAGRSDSSATSTSREIRLRYHTDFKFARDITIAVDNLFAQIAAGDDRAIELTRDYLRPGTDLLSEQYAIDLPEPQVKAKPEKQQLTFKTGWSEWRDSNDGIRTPFLKALANAKDFSSCRWKARLKPSHFHFNSLRPRHLRIETQLNLSIQCREEEGKPMVPWEKLSINDMAFSRLKNDLTKKLTHTYRTYLQHAFGVELVETETQGEH